jgi:thiamine-phosphate pyrophosphorylase
MRHELVTSDLQFNRELLQSRDSEGDVGISMETPDQAEPRDLPLMIIANARRVQESLRVIEELAKVPDSGLDSEKFKQSRFSLYTIERVLFSRLLRKDKTKNITGLYVIIDTQALGERSHLEVARQVIHGGAKVIQLRDKLQSKKELINLSRRLQNLCTKHNVLFIVNDYLDVALASDADGLHVGQGDLPVETARNLLPIDKILGCSTTTVEQALAAQADGADYIAVGSIYPTGSKATATLVGLERLRKVRKAITGPVVAIGGINENNVSEVVTAGADSVAVISAVLAARSPEEAARRIANKFEQK